MIRPICPNVLETQKPITLALPFLMTLMKAPWCKLDARMALTTKHVSQAYRLK